MHYAQGPLNVPTQKSIPGCVSPLARGMQELLSGQAQRTWSSRDPAESQQAVGPPLPHACSSSGLSLPGRICSPCPAGGDARLSLPPSRDRTLRPEPQTAAAAGKPKPSGWTGKGLLKPYCYSLKQAWLLESLVTRLKFNSSLTV